LGGTREGIEQSAPDSQAAGCFAEEGPRSSALVVIRRAYKGRIARCTIAGELTQSYQSS